MAHANGVLVAPEKTPTKPTPANSATGSGMNRLSALPNVAPIKNKKTDSGCTFVKGAMIVGKPRPTNWVVPIAKTARATILPPQRGAEASEVARPIYRLGNPPFVWRYPRARPIHQTNA